MMKIIVTACSSVLPLNYLLSCLFFCPFIAKISSQEYIDLVAFAMLLITAVGLIRLMKNNKRDD